MILSESNDKVSNDKKVEALNDHYKDTCLRLAGYRKQRNRLAFYAAITIAITLFLGLAPNETRYYVISFFFRSAADRVITNTTGNVIFNVYVRLLPALILMSVALTYKHYRIAINKQFTYVEMLESELNSLYPESDLFNRETNFSSRESTDFAMWSSWMYSKLLIGGCVSLIVVHAWQIIHNLGLLKSYSHKTNEIEAIIAEVSIAIAVTGFSFLSMIYFYTKKPLTTESITKLLKTGREE